MSATYEIERKFLVKNRPAELAAAEAKSLRQGYITTGDTEVRLRHDGANATLTCKQGGGLKRREEEIALSPEQFQTLWPLTDTQRIEKTRYLLPHQNHLIELDVYHGQHAPLIVAEVEFESEQASRSFTPPSYFGPEVTNDSRYKNKNLATQGPPAAP